MRQEQILEQAKEICMRYQAKELILFGSRAAGTAQERSDVDLAVGGAEHFDALSEDLRGIPTLLSLDILNLDTCGNQALVKEVREHGRKIL